MANHLHRAKILDRISKLLVCALFLSFLMTGVRVDTATANTGALAMEESTVDIALSLSSTSNVTPQTTVSAEVRTAWATFLPSAALIPPSHL